MSQDLSCEITADTTPETRPDGYKLLDAIRWSADSDPGSSSGHSSPWGRKGQRQASRGESREGFLVESQKGNRIAPMKWQHFEIDINLERRAGPWARVIPRGENVQWNVNSLRFQKKFRVQGALPGAQRDVRDSLGEIWRSLNPRSAVKEFGKTSLGLRALRGSIIKVTREYNKLTG